MEQLTELINGLSKAKGCLTMCSKKTLQIVQLVQVLASLVEKLEQQSEELKKLQATINSITSVEPLASIQVDIKDKVD
jgi:hypothetical protein